MLRRIDTALELLGWTVAVFFVTMLFFGPHVVAEDKAQTQGADAAGAADGRVVFTGTCGSCHTLSAAGTSGTLGPNLDRASLDAAAIEHIVRDGSGRMPGLGEGLSDDEIAAVAQFVASAGATGGAKGGAADGKAVFSGTCGSCHTLSSAGTSGTVGPNLDDISLDAGAIERIVRDGSGGMPALGGKLSDDEIKAVAGFVAGK